MAGTCLKPPIGWRCTREPDHEGPCAALQLVDTKAKFVEIKLHTEWSPAFRLSKEQKEATAAWRSAHDQEKHIPPGKEYRYSGAIGGAYTWSFTPTSLGTAITVRCSCGESIDVSDYDDW